MITRKVKIGNIEIGGSNPLRIQGMLKTPIKDREGLKKEARKLVCAGAEIIRCAVEKKEDAEVIYSVLKDIGLPLVADCHFQESIVKAAFSAGFDKIRVNPGNMREDTVMKSVELAQKYGKALRLGFNTGSCSAKGPVELANLALKWDRRLINAGFKNFVVSMKSASVKETVESNRIFSTHSDTPLHIGVTASGPSFEGLIKSSAGLGALLVDEVGDTIRVSVTGSSEKEVEAAVILKESIEGRNRKLEIISCPTCSRSRVDVLGLVERLISDLSEEDLKKPLSVAVMGCEVNGPGEAARSDVGICGMKSSGMLIKKGNRIGKVDKKEIVDVLIREIRQL